MLHFYKVFFLFNAIKAAPKKELRKFASFGHNKIFTENLQLFTFLNTTKESLNKFQMSALLNMTKATQNKLQMFSVFDHKCFTLQIPNVRFFFEHSKFFGGKSFKCSLILKA